MPTSYFFSSAFSFSFASISDAVAEMSSKRVGSVVVSPDGHDVTGIFTERDLIQKVIQRQCDVEIQHRNENFVSTLKNGCSTSPLNINVDTTFFLFL